MRIVFMGTPEFSVPVLEALAARHQIAAVYSQPPRPAGRGKKERPSPVHAKALELGLPVLTPLNFRAPAERAAFAAHDAEVAVVVAYGLILPQEVLDAPRRGCLNIHASLLPRWRGAAPIHRAIMAGDAQTGICIMQMEAGLDTGPVLLRAALPIAPDETTGHLHDRLSGLGARLILAALEQVDTLVPQPQPDIGVTYAHKIDKAEARIDWSLPADQLARQVNGLSPFPGAWTMAGAERLKLLRATVVWPGAFRSASAGAAGGPPGQVLAGEGAVGFCVQCGAGALGILEAQREGKRPMPAAEIVKGHGLPGTLV